DSPGMRAGGKGNTRIVPVPDVRLHTLAAMYHPRKVTPASIEFVDPLVAGQQGVHFADSLVSLMRDADALAHVVRAFQNPAVPQRHRLRGLGVLSSKAQLVVLNLDEAHIDPEDPEVEQFRAQVQTPGLEVMPLYGKIESEIAQLPAEEAESFLHEIGLPQSGLA